MALCLQRGQCAVNQRRRTVFLLVEQLGGQLSGVDQGLRVGQPTVLAVDFFPFVRRRCELVDLGNLPDQALAVLAQAGLAVGGCLQGLALLAPLGPAGVCGGGVDAGVGIKQVAHRAGARQALPGVLAVDVHQTVSQGFQLGHCGSAAVDPGAAAAFCIDRAPHQQALFQRKSLVIEPLRDRWQQIELGGNLATRRAFAHHAGLGARTQGQLQSVDQDRFARAGFPCQHGEAGGQIKVERLHNDKVAQGNAAEAHGVGGERDRIAKFVF